MSMLMAMRRGATPTSTIGKGIPGAERLMTSNDIDGYVISHRGISGFFPFPSEQGGMFVYFVVISLWFIFFSRLVFSGKDGYEPDIFIRPNAKKSVARSLCLGGRETANRPIHRPHHHHHQARHHRTSVYTSPTSTHLNLILSRWPPRSVSLNLPPTSPSVLVPQRARMCLVCATCLRGECRANFASQRRAETRTMLAVNRCQ